jgi:hypothetical protein
MTVSLSSLVIGLSPSHAKLPRPAKSPGIVKLEDSKDDMAQILADAWAGHL